MDEWILFRLGVFTGAVEAHMEMKSTFSLICPLKESVRVPDGELAVLNHIFTYKPASEESSSLLQSIMSFQMRWLWKLFIFASTNEWL